MRKWKCVKLNGTVGFTKGKFYDVEDDGTIRYDSGNISGCKINKEGKCWEADFEEIKEDEMKFKVGDKVRIKGGTNQVGWESIMLKYIDTCGMLESINDCIPSLCVSLDLDGEFWWFNEEDLELVESSHEIHITTKGTTTHAIMKEDGKIVKRVEAKLHPDDEFNFRHGARLCMSRLFRDELKAIGNDKPKFVKAKVGDRIKIVNLNSNEHFVSLCDGDILEVFSVSSDGIGASTNSGKSGYFSDEEEEYIIIPNTTIDFSTVTTDDLLSEIKRRMK